MNDQEIRSALQDALEDTIPSSQVHLWPRVQARIAVGATHIGKSMPTTRRRFAFTAMAISILLVVILFTPQGRAFAQRMVRFFAVTEQTSFPIPTELVAPAPDTPTPPITRTLPLEPAAALPTAKPAIDDATCRSAASQSSYFCQLQAVEMQAGFNAREFPQDPKGLKFSTTTYLPATREITMEFEVTAGGGYLFLYQGVGNFPEAANHWGEVPQDAVEQVSVSGYYAEIVSGGFIVYADSTEAVWEPGGRLRLAWQAGDRWFLLEKMGDPYPIEWITKDQMIALAEGLVDDRAIDAQPPLDPENLATVEQAEALAGFEIPTPSLLPAGYELKQVAWTDDVARLMYGPKAATASELFLFMGQITDHNAIDGCMDCPSGAVETVQVGPWQGWYWRGLFQGDAPAENNQPTPAWNGDAAHWTLTWRSDQLWFTLIYSPAENSANVADREMLIKIAEHISVK